MLLLLVVSFFSLASHALAALAPTARTAPHRPLHSRIASPRPPDRAPHRTPGSPGSPRAQVWLNGERVKIGSFKEYADMFLPAEDKAPRVFEKLSDRWEIIAAVSGSRAERSV